MVVNCQRLMMTDVPSLSEAQSITEACRVMTSFGSPVLPVMGPDDSLIGVFNETGVLRSVGEQCKPHYTMIGDWMIGDSASIGPDDPALQALQLMVNTGSTSVNVLEDNRLVGILLDRDIISFICSEIDMLLSSGEHPDIEQDLQHASLNRILVDLPVLTGSLRLYRGAGELLKQDSMASLVQDDDPVRQRSLGAIPRFGIITSWDFVRSIAADALLSSHLWSWSMAPRLSDKKLDLIQIGHWMASNHFRHYLVPLYQGHIGAITDRELLRYLLAIMERLSRN